jgi:hypothetical protein
LNKGRVHNTLGNIDALSSLELQKGPKRKGNYKRGLAISIEDPGGN